MAGVFCAMNNECILALDLGTTAFKCAAVDAEGVIDEPVTVGYLLDYAGGHVTFPPERYLLLALEALKAAAATAKRANCRVRAIGISSQAQTYIALDAQGQPVQPAVVWTDARAVTEAERVAQAIPDFIRHSGFQQPLAQQFLPKVMHAVRPGGLAADRVWKFLLLNEYLICHLTGQAYGDEVNQGMGGFFDITRRAWSPAALALAGIESRQLADVAPAAAISQPLRAAYARQLGLAEVPVFSCGNDQSCGAAGAGLTGADDLLCNFGTALVVYAVRATLPAALGAHQIAGIDPLTGRYFLLGVASECGNIIEWARNAFHAELDFNDMIRYAAALEPAASDDGPPQLQPRGNGRFDLTGLSAGHGPDLVIRGILDYYGRAFAALLAGIGPQGASGRLVAAGGLSKSEAWLAFLERACAVTFTPAPSEHIGLLGIRNIVQAKEAPAA